jgi:serine/threonine protein kinase
MHQHNILHRDIKGPSIVLLSCLTVSGGANILVSRDNRLKIADWGLARSFYSKMQKSVIHRFSSLHSPSQIDK